VTAPFQFPEPAPFRAPPLRAPTPRRRAIPVPFIQPRHFRPVTEAPMRPRHVVPARPGDERGFIHKKLLRTVSKISGIVPIPGAGVVSAITGRLGGSGRTVPRTLTARPTRFSQEEKEFGRNLKFGGGETQRFRGFGEEGCLVPGMRRDPGTGKCKFFVGDRAGPNGGAPVGDAVLGRYGAGVEPGIQTIDRAVCGKGMQLGDDGICYHKSAISNKQRMWPAGRRPLLTGGDMNAISIAARSGRRLEGATKRLQRMGMMKKPARARATRAHHHHPAAGG